MSKPLLAVLIPTRGFIFTKTMMALIRELSAFDHAYFFTYDIPLPDSRNALVQSAVDSKIPFTHYLMIDDDIVLPELGIKDMLILDKPIVLIDYPSHWMGKGANTGTAVYDEWLEGDPVEGRPVLFGGLGCSLIKKEVIEALEQPYFRKGGKQFDRDKKGKIHLYGVGSGDGGEDFEFYQDCKAKGFEITMVHGKVCGHAKVMKHIGVITPGKYVTQHDIIIANKIERPLK